MNMRRSLTVLGLALLAVDAHAEGWCDLAAGSYDLVSNGTVSDQVYVVGQLSAASSAIWIPIADSTVGKADVALVLAAQMTGKGISLYLNAPSATCANFASWSTIGSIRHVKIIQ
jgi:hypothetical protein